jgi:hypothetical protein
MEALKKWFGDHTTESEQESASITKITPLGPWKIPFTDGWWLVENHDVQRFKEEHGLL